MTNHLFIYLYQDYYFIFYFIHLDFVVFGLFPLHIDFKMFILQIVYFPNEIDLICSIGLFVLTFHSNMDWSYLSFRCCIGVWCSLLLLIMVALDLSSLVKFITRFTEESFALLIALIFMIEAVKKTYSISRYYQVNQ